MTQWINVGLPVAVTTALIGGLTTVLSNNIGIVIASSSFGGAGAAIVTQQRKRQLNLSQEQALSQDLKNSLYEVSEPLNQRLDNVCKAINIIQTRQESQSNPDLSIPIQQEFRTALLPLSQTLDTINSRLEILEDYSQRRPSDLLKVSDIFRASITELRADIKSRDVDLNPPDFDQDSDIEPSHQDAEAIEVDEESSHEEDAFQLLHEWLISNDIKVLSSRSDNEGQDNVLDRIALSMGKKTNELKGLREALKYAVRTKKNAKLSLKTQAEIRHSTSICNRFQKYGMIKNYYYNRDEKSIYFKSQSQGRFDKFLTGEWFERSVFQMIIEWLDNEGYEAGWLINPKVEFANGDVFELDLLFMIEGQPLWLECKSGRNYNDKFVTYSEHRKKLHIPESHSFMVILDCPDQDANDLTQLWDLSIVNENNFMEVIKNLFPHEQEN